MDACICLIEFSITAMAGFVCLLALCVCVCVCVIFTSPITSLMDSGTHGLNQIPPLNSSKKEYVFNNFNNFNNFLLFKES